MVSEVGSQRRWQLDVRSLKGGLAQICKSMDFADCQFTVGTRQFKGHRLILAARSPMFARMLMKDGNSKLPMTNIEIHDVSEKPFEILLNYIYTNSIGQMDSKELELDVYQAAIKYDQQGLKHACEQRIKKWEITCENVIALLQMSDVQLVRNLCCEFLSEQARAVLNSDGILVASSDTLSLMRVQGYLNGIPPLELLTNFVRWAKQCYPKDEDFKRVREQLLIPSRVTNKSLMSCIGFERLAPTELGKVISDYPNLLTTEEVSIFFQQTFVAEEMRPALPKW